MTIVVVKLWGRNIGAVSWDVDKNLGYFEYEPDFLRSGIELSPFMMPLSREIYSFPALARASFYGLPGMLSDALPDKFGNALIDTWLATQGRQSSDFNPVERLSYIGSRAMGALEFEPSINRQLKNTQAIDVEALVNLASEILKNRERLNVSFANQERENSLNEILQVGTSAGGARAKAVIAWNEQTNEVRSGQVDAGHGFTYWLLKFDGVEGNGDKELNDPKGYGLIEYAYSLMARAAGINMMECRIFKENGRNHFMTKRFDRNDEGQKIHLQSFGALEHFDFNMAGAYSYEQVFQTMRKLSLSMDQIEQQFRRMVFNIIARNQDDHVKNIAFLMNKAGKWSLSPAYDMTYAYNPSGSWTDTHQMSLQGKRENFELDDFISCGKLIGLMRGRAVHIVNDVQQVVKKWPAFARKAEVEPSLIDKITNSHRNLIE